MERLWELLLTDVRQDFRFARRISRYFSTGESRDFSQFSTPRKESDTVEILSGIFEGKTTGTPISMMVRNTSQRSGDYGDIATYYRPGHADYTFDQKYGFRDYRGGGRSSGRETIGRVAAGAIASKICLEQVCGFLKSRLDKGQKIVPVSVNFSRRHLEESDLVERITGTIDRFGIDRSYIEIELTESEDYQNYEIMSSVIERLKERGISTSIDDFGTGFSSLNMIKKVDLDTIKIDKSLIPFDDVNNNKHQDIVMFSSIINLIGRLGKKSVAEGVETTQQLDYLEKLGCDIVQGYVFDKPLPKDEFEHRLESGYSL